MLDGVVIDARRNGVSVEILVLMLWQAEGLNVSTGQMIALGRWVMSV